MAQHLVHSLPEPQNRLSDFRSLTRAPSLPPTKHEVWQIDQTIQKARRAASSLSLGFLLPFCLLELPAVGFSVGLWRPSLSRKVIGEAGILDILHICYF